MSENKYGEVKTRKNIFPNDAREIVKKGTIGILISQCPVSEKTKGILAEAHVTLYENVESTEIEEFREKIKEELVEKINDATNQIKEIVEKREQEKEKGE